MAKNTSICFFLACLSGIASAQSQQNGVNMPEWPRTDASQREIAEWIFSVGGYVELDTSALCFETDDLPQEIAIRQVSLPPEHREIDKLLGHLSSLPAMTTLDELDLGNMSTESSAITAAGLDRLRALPNLKCLNLMGAHLDEAEFKALVNLRLITIVLMGTNTTDKHIAQLCAARGLESVDLSNTEVSINCVSYLRKLPNLRDVSFPHQIITDKNLAVISELGTLRRFCASQGRVSDRGLAHLGRMVNLEDLALDNTDITDGGLRSLDQLTELKRLGLRSTNITDEGLKRVEHFEQLEALDLSSTQITDAGMVSVGKLLRLKRLKLEDTAVGNIGINELRGLSLCSLALSGTNVGNDGMQVIGNMDSLTSLEVPSTRITDVGMAHLKGLRLLENLVFSETDVSDTSIPVLSSFKKIHFMLTSEHISQEGRRVLKRALPLWR